MKKSEEVPYTPSPPKHPFVSDGLIVRIGPHFVAKAISHTYARRIARALNITKPTAKGY